MTGDRVEEILDAAYRCFCRHGVRRTTMEDIATEAGMSRPAVYQYVRSKEDAFRRLATRLFETMFTQAQAAAGSGPLPERLFQILAAKLALTQQLFRDSPHAAEMLGEHARVSADLDARFVAQLSGLLATAVTEAAARGEIALGPGDDPQEIAEIAVAFTRGLEADLTDEHRPQARLRRGLALMVGGLAGSH